MTAKPVFNAFRGGEGGSDDMYRVCGRVLVKLATIDYGVGRELEFGEVRVS